MYPHKNDVSVEEFINQLNICQAILIEVIEYIKSKDLKGFVFHCEDKGILEKGKYGPEVVVKDLDSAAANVRLMVSVIGAQIECESAADDAMMRLIGDIVFGPPTENQT
jgi:hypothetical protein